MGVESGIFGLIDNVSTSRNWQISRTREGKTYVASNTKAGTGRKPGNKDWTGNYNAYGGVPAVKPKDTFNFAGYTKETGGKKYAGDAIVDSVQVNWNWEAADIVSHTVNFGSNGALTISDVAPGGLDTTFPDCPSPIGQTPSFMLLGGGSASYSDLCVTTVQLTLQAPSKTYTNSCTNGIVMRKPGVFDWTAAIAVQNDDQDELGFEPGDYIALRIPVGLDPDTDDPLFWDLMWGYVGEHSNFVVDRETGAIIGFTVNVAMAGFDHVTGDEETGTVIAPDETVWWPEA